MVDRYTKTILTIIALSLVIIILRDVPIVRDAVAQTTGYKGNTVAVTIRGIDECTECAWDTIPVRVVNR
jgi:hypothetical protein